MVEEIDLGRRAGLVQKNNAFRLPREMGQLGKATGSGINRAAHRILTWRGEKIGVEQRTQRGDADSRTGAAEKLSARHHQAFGFREIHGATSGFGDQGHNYYIRCAIGRHKYGRVGGLIPDDEPCEAALSRTSPCENPSPVNRGTRGLPATPRFPLLPLREGAPRLRRDSNWMER